MNIVLITFTQDYGLDSNFSYNLILLMYLLIDIKSIRMVSRQVIIQIKLILPYKNPMLHLKDFLLVFQISPFFL